MHKFSPLSFLLIWPTLGFGQTPSPTPSPVTPEGIPPWITSPPPKADSGTAMDLRDGELPSVDSLRLEGGVESGLGDRFVETIPIMNGDLFTTSTIFASDEVLPEYANLDVRRLVEISLKSNFDLINTDRSVRIARSQTRSEEAFFIPFVDLVGNARYRESRDRDSTSLGFPVEKDTRETDTKSSSGGIEVTQNLPTGGTITASGSESKTTTKVSDGDETNDQRSRNFGVEAEVRYLQPLLRGAGVDVATSNLRNARLSELDSILGQRISERDTALRVIRQYFQIASLKQQLEVSAGALRERRKFLEETRTKYEVGRVAESEILRAEIQYLQEVESAISRRQQLENAREDLLILMGLPLDTKITLVDITPALMNQGRVDLPPVEDAIASALASRTELMRSDIGITQSEIELRVSRNAMLPELNVDAGYNRSDSDNNLDDANGWKDTGWDAGVSLRIPVINIQRRESLRQSAIRLDQTRTNRLSLERSITQEVINAHRSVLSTEAQLTILKKTVEQARKNLELTNGSFEVGFNSITEVRLAQDDLFQAESRYSSALLNYQSALAQLYTSMGQPLY